MAVWLWNIFEQLPWLCHFKQGCTPLKRSLSHLYSTFSPWHSSCIYIRWFENTSHLKSMFYNFLNKSECACASWPLWMVVSWKLKKSVAQFLTQWCLQWNPNCRTAVQSPILCTVHMFLLQDECSVNTISGDRAHITEWASAYASDSISDYDRTSLIHPNIHMKFQASVGHVVQVFGAFLCIVYTLLNLLYHIICLGEFMTWKCHICF